MKDKADISWINTLKTICMFVIYFYHCEVYAKYSNSIIDSLYGPFFTNAFFIVSGYLLIRRQLSSSVSSQSMSFYLSPNGEGNRVLNNIWFKMVLPSMFFAGILYLPKVIIRGEVFKFSIFLNETILGGCYWFTSALIIAELLMILTLSFKKKLSVLLLIGLILAVISNILYHKQVFFWNTISLPWFYKSGMIAYLLMSLGGYYWKYEERIDRIISRLFFLGALVYILLVLLGRDYTHYIITRGQIGVLGLFAIVLSTAYLIWLCKRLRANKLTNYVGRHTLGMYFMSGAIPNVICILGCRMGLEINLWTILCYTIISYIISLLITFCLYEYMPFIFDIRNIKIKLN